MNVITMKEDYAASNIVAKENLVDDLLDICIEYS